MSSTHPYSGGFNPASTLPYTEQMKCIWCGLLELHPVHDVQPEGMSTHEPMPVPDPTRGNIQDLVIEDIAERKRVGIARYGTALQPFNGRNALVDLYQELLDACMYVRQLIEEDRLYVGTQDIDQIGSGYPERYASGTVRLGRAPLTADALAVASREWEQRVTDARAAGQSTQHQPRHVGLFEHMVDTGLDIAEHAPVVVVDHDPA